jgi:hypothetical protein
MLVMLAGCSGSTPRAAEPQSSAGPTGSLSAQQLRAQLLQKSDLPGLPRLRDYAGAELTTQATPQLALCKPTTPSGPHQIANVIAESDVPGRVKVFEVLSVYADAAAAQAAFRQAVADAKACATYTDGGIAHRVTELAPVEVGADEAVHYAVVTSDVISGDVRTIARRGTALVLITGFGAPPTKQPLLDYQADVMRKALDRLQR